VIVSFVYPSSHHRTGGVTVLYEMANGLARRGHDVHFVHGPATPYRVGSLDELPPFRFEPGIAHHLVDSLDDPRLPAGDVVMLHEAPARLGLPFGIVQGYRMLAEEVERELFRAPAPKACVARWLIDVVAGYGAPPEQLSYVPLGIDHGVFAVRTPQARRPYDVAMLSHPHREKGLVVGIEVLEALRQRRPDLRALVFGMDPPARALPPGVEFWQAPDHATLADRIYNHTRVFVQPSFHEGFGYTAVEAMACGCALVTTDNGGSRDYARPGETALVVPPGDGNGLADAADRLLRDDRERERLADAGARLVREEFDWDHTAAVLEGHLEAYLADPPRYRRQPAEVAAGVDAR
jgi:glycosyltransferase involved in cell wall biosynthesis